MTTPQPNNKGRLPGIIPCKHFRDRLPACGRCRCCPRLEFAGAGEAETVRIVCPVCRASTLPHHDGNLVFAAWVELSRRLGAVHHGVSQ